MSRLDNFDDWNGAAESLRRERVKTNDGEVDMGVLLAHIDALENVVNANADQLARAWQRIFALTTRVAALENTPRKNAISEQGKSP